MGVEQEGNDTFFRAAGLIGGKENNRVSPLLSQIVREFRLHDVTRLLQSGKLPDHYFFDDSGAYNYVQQVEQWANLTNQLMLSSPHAAELAREIEDNLDHGYNHFRRIAYWDKYIFGKDSRLRSDEAYLFFQFSKEFAIRTHDLVELSTNRKAEHDRMAALFTFAFLEDQRSTVFGLLESKEHPQPITDEQTQKLIWGAAFIVLHHSKPEAIPSIADLEKNGLFNSAELYRDMMNYAMTQGNTLYKYFRPFIQVQRTLEAIRDRQFIQPHFTHDELRGLVKQAWMLAACDKLDGTFPPDLSASRTVLTRPKRPFYMRMDGELPLEEEFAARVAGGGGHESRCDLDRILFELTRVKSFENLSPYVAYAFRFGLEEKAKFFLGAIPPFMRGDFNPYLKGYASYFSQIAFQLMRKAGIDENRSRYIAGEPNQLKLFEKLESALVLQNVDPVAGRYVLDTIIHERGIVAAALEHKYALLQADQLTAEEIKRVKLFLEKTIHVQAQSMRKAPGPAILTLPYKTYYHIPVPPLKK